LHFPGSNIPAAAAASIFLLAKDTAPHFTPKGRAAIFTHKFDYPGKPLADSRALFALPVRLMAHNLLRNSPDLCIILNHFEFALQQNSKKNIVRSKKTANKMT